MPVMPEASDEVVATNWVPSADAATADHAAAGAVVCVQFVPELVEVKILPVKLPEGVAHDAAAKRLPSA